MKLVTLYNSKGEVSAFLGYPHVFNLLGEWIGFVTPERDVYSVLGHYVGFLSDDRRILRARTLLIQKPQLQPPAEPERALPPASIPLAPLMSELTHSVIDVFIEEPHRLHTLDMGELRPDLE